MSVQHGRKVACKVASKAPMLVNQSAFNRTCDQCHDVIPCTYTNGVLQELSLSSVWRWRIEEAEGEERRRGGSISISPCSPAVPSFQAVPSFNAVPCSFTSVGGSDSRGPCCR